MLTYSYAQDLETHGEKWHSREQTDQWRDTVCEQHQPDYPVWAKKQYSCKSCYINHVILGTTSSFLSCNLDGRRIRKRLLSESTFSRLLWKKAMYAEVLIHILRHENCSVLQSTPFRQHEAVFTAGFNKLLSAVLPHQHGIQSVNG